jgi:hypothetical protein
MRKKVVILVVELFFTHISLAQSPPVQYALKISLPFESPTGYVLYHPLDYGRDGVIQVSCNELNSFCFQKFSEELNLEKTNKVDIKDRLQYKNDFERMIQTENKTYLLTREVRNDAQTEGISALAFLPDKLDFAAHSVSLFQSTDRVAINRGTYSYSLSQDKTKMMFSYRLVPKIKSDVISKAIIGLYAFDENLQKLWGGEFEMPYTERRMEILDYTISNDGKIALTVRVYEDNEREMTTKEGLRNYHYELLLYQKENIPARKVQIKLDSLFPQEAFVYEDGYQNLMVTGLYTRKLNSPVIGAYQVKLDLNQLEEKQNAYLADGMITARKYEIPVSVIGSYSSQDQYKKLMLDQKEEKKRGVNKLYIRKIYCTEEGSVKILTEVYKTKSNTIYQKKKNIVDIYFGDIYIFSIDKMENLQWVKKVPKAQHRPDAGGAALSFNSIATGNDLHLFYLDKKENCVISENKRPSVFQRKNSGYLIETVIKDDGNISRFDLNYKKPTTIDFFICYFREAQTDKLIYVERTARKNILYELKQK